MESSGGSSWAVTEFDVRDFEFRWQIRHLDDCPLLCGQSLDSPVFGDSLQWSLRLYPRGCDGENGSHAALFVVLRSDADGVHAGVELAVADAVVRHLPRRRCHVDLPFGLRRLASRRQLADLSVDGALDLYCRIRVDSVRVRAGPDSSDGVDGRLSADLGRLLDAPRRADVTLMVQGRSYGAVRAVLAARSRVLAALVDAAGAEYDTIYLRDVDRRVLELMLRFIYTGTVDLNIDVDTQRRLLAAAERYELTSLQRRLRCAGNRLKNEVVVVDDDEEIESLCSRGRRCLGQCCRFDPTDGGCSFRPC